MSEEDVIVCPISMGESFGFIAGLVTATYASAEFAPCEPEPKEMCKLAAETNAKWMLVNNSLLKILLENAREYRPLLPNGLQFLAPADGLSSEMVLNVLDNLGCQIITGYFSTECSSFATLIPADMNDSNYRSFFPILLPYPLEEDCKPQKLTFMITTAHPFKTGSLENW
jgi:acyl-CoA synthetase (AMP-forming)/AMP-acid ligase II